MTSIDQIEVLERIPLPGSVGIFNQEEILAALQKIPSDHFAIEVSFAVEESLAGLFDEVNVSDTLLEAYRLAFPGISEQYKLHERYAYMLEQGPAHARGFVSNLKGKLAELETVDHLEEIYPEYEFEMALKANQPVWDIRGINGDGHGIHVQVKAGGEEYAGDVLDRMLEDPDVLFATTTEIRDTLVHKYPELDQQSIDLPFSNAELSEITEDDIQTLSEMMGVNVPDHVEEVIDATSDTVIVGRMIFEAVNVQKEFKTVKIEKKMKITAMKILVLAQRVIVSGGLMKAGFVAGSLFSPVGGILTLLAAWYGATKINKKLRSNMVKFALYLARMSEEEFFYQKNKSTIDQIGLSLASTARIVEVQ